MVTALVSRLYITHDREYYSTFLSSSRVVHDHDAMVSCNCPICHAEDFLAVEAEYLDYNPIISTLDFEFEVVPTAQAIRFIHTSSLRGPPCLS